MTIQTLEQLILYFLIIDAIIQYYDEDMIIHLTVGSIKIL